MNLSDLRYLIAIADHLHFGRAAASCFVSQPTLSTQLRKLERELGVELVERNPRHVMLTAAGARVVEHARRAVAEADAIEDVARQARDPESGTLRIGIFPTLGPYLLPHVVPALHARFPRLELLLVEEKTEVVLQQLHDGKLDAGVLALPVDDERLHHSPLFDEDFVLAAPSSHPLAGDDSPIDLSDLQGEHILLLEDGHCLRDQALSLYQAQQNESFARLRQQMAIADQNRQSIRLFDTAILPQARLAVESALASYRVSRADMLTLLDSQMSLYGYAASRAAAVAALHKARAEIDLLTGAALP